MNLDILATVYIFQSVLFHWGLNEVDTFKSSSILNYYHTKKGFYAQRKDLMLRLIEIDGIEGVKEINSTLDFNY